MPASLEAILDGICEVGHITILTGEPQFLSRGDHLPVTQESRRVGVMER